MTMIISVPLTVCIIFAIQVLPHIMHRCLYIDFPNQCIFFRCVVSRFVYRVLIFRCIIIGTANQAYNENRAKRQCPFTVPHQQSPLAKRFEPILCSYLAWVFKRDFSLLVTSKLAINYLLEIMSANFSFISIRLENPSTVIFQTE